MQKTVIDDNQEPSFPQPTQNKTIEFEIPTEFVKLPSKGKIYGPDSNLFQKEELEIRVMTAKDEDILTSRALVRKNLVIQRLLQNILVDKSINVNELIRGDREALLIALRITGYGTDYNVNLTCPQCMSTFMHNVDLSKLEIKFLEIEPLEPNVNMFDLILPVSSKEVIWKFIDFVDESQIADIQKNRKKKLNTDVDNLVTLRLLHSIVSIDGVADRNLIASATKNMPARDSLALRNYIDESEACIKMNSDVTCENCGEESAVDIPMTAGFFWPNV